MARGLLLSSAALNASIEAVADRCDGGILRVYSGTQPASADTAATGTLLAEMAFPNPAFSVASGTATAGNMIVDLANDTGTATWFRAFTAADEPVFDGTVGEADADLIIDDDAIVVGELVDVTELTYGMPVVIPPPVYHATVATLMPEPSVLGAATYTPDTPDPPDPPGFVIYGFGSGVTGGTGGTIRNVSTVAELRSALAASGTRIIRFIAGGDYDMGGTGVTVTNGNLTIDGSTASSPVITHNGMWIFRCNNVLVKQVRFRATGPGLTPGDTDTDAVSLGVYNGSLRYSGFAFDHCEFLWGPDVSFTALGGITDCTMQYCIFGEGLFASVQPESFGGPLGDADGHGLNMNLTAKHASGHERFTFYNCLVTTSQGRNLRFQNARTVDIINCVIYNHHEGPQGAQYALNMINNYYKEGPAPAAAGLSTPNRLQWRTQIGGEMTSAPAQSVYLSGNVAANFTFATPGGADASVLATTPRHTPSISGANLRTAAAAFTHVLANAGGRLPSMDAHTVRILNNVINGTGKYRDGYIWSSNTHHYPPVEH